MGLVYNLLIPLLHGPGISGIVRCNGPFPGVSTPVLTTRNFTLYTTVRAIHQNVILIALLTHEIFNSS
jgi:hypothetical protein